MEKENKAFQEFGVVPFETWDIKTFEDRYEFEGIASVFNTPDRVKDIVHSGAFERTIKHHKGKFPLAEMHDVKRLIGNAHVHEDKKGLVVSPGVLIRGLQNAENAYLLLKNKVYDGLSFAFRPIKREFRAGYRHLKEVAVGEITVAPRSLICHPDAIITDVKMMGQSLDDFYEELKLALFPEEDIEKYMEQKIKEIESVLQ